MPPEPSVTSACQPLCECTLRYSSALLAKSFARPGPKSVSPATYSAGAKLVVWCRRISVCFIVRLLSYSWLISTENRGSDVACSNFELLCGYRQSLNAFRNDPDAPQSLL